MYYGDFSKRELRLLHFYSQENVKGEFNLSKIESLIKGFTLLDYLEPGTYFTLENSQLNLGLTPNTKSKIDGILSYKSDQNLSGIIGKFDLSLQNFFGLGRHATLSWHHPTLTSNFIAIQLKEPFIFSYPFSLESSFRQDFRDSTYVKRDIQFGLSYHISPRFEVGITLSEDYIYTLNDENASGSLTVSGLTMTYRKIGTQFDVAFNSSGSLRQNKNETSYILTHNSNITFQRNTLGITLKTESGLNNTENTIPIYYQFALGGANFLRGSYFEQYKCDSYGGLSFEGGIYRLKSHFLLFYDTAYLYPEKLFIHQTGFQIQVPAGSNTLQITIGFDSKEPLSQGKIHISWKL